jgi:hypothetical protein
MTADELTLDRILELIKQAKLALEGGAAKAPDRLLQHRQLTDALEWLARKYQRDARIEAEIKLAILDLHKTIKQYPRTYDVKHGQAIEYRWMVKSPAEFADAVNRLLGLATKADDIGR